MSLVHMFPSIRLRFVEALAWFLARIPLTDDEVAELSARYRRQAFWMAGGAQLRAVQDIFDAIARSIDSGEGFGSFKRDILSRIADAWSKGGHRLETIWINNVQRAHNAGRHAQHTAPGNRRARPYWMYDAVLDSRTTPICKDRDGTVQPADSSWWQSNYPPLHHRCRSGVRALTRRQGEARAQLHLGDLPPAQSGFGLAPSGADGDRDPIDPRGIDAGLVGIWERRKQEAAA